ncbi:hypothetical protein CRG98_029906 [Punica granatum]|uniref:Retroviral polymerase SH3-like domain-containing protein n=1 Tax=Punica granatum TaxID=22663 RepID=A0A2I0J086_PUNGR|nr:hypothetical protein CRG98_029906 [Punica granatum]
MSFLKIWGYEVYVKRLFSDKLGPKSDKYYFVGYPKETRGYYFYNPIEGKVFVARIAVFLEKEFLFKGTNNDVLLVDNDEPTTYAEVVIGLDSEKWLKAMRSEMESMYTNQVWTLVDSPEGVKPIGFKEFGFIKNEDEPCIYKKDSKKGSLPMLHGISLSKAQSSSTQEERDYMSRIPYASAIGSIMYAMLCTICAPEFYLVRARNARVTAWLGSVHLSGDSRRTHVRRSRHLLFATRRLRAVKSPRSRGTGYT